MLSKGISPQLEDKIKRYQSLQQQISGIQQQVQTLNLEKLEIEKAIKEIEELPDDEICYRSIGRLMVKSNIKETKTKLNDQKELNDTQVKFYEKNFEKLKKQYEDLEKEIRTALETKK
ncbi:MAG: prefoldin subunit beta [Asgard group archaeon]|nr:prefoldin subunit beta [Asgard group archaeon]